MELFIFARFHAREGREEAAAAALREVVGPTAAEPGCLAIGAFRASLDPRLFFIHSRWVDEAAFDLHAVLPHTVLFIRRMNELTDQPVEVVRTLPL
jgi:quinol monooxygenase YgiN